jgi:hypothetical protein
MRTTFMQSSSMRPLLSCGTHVRAPLILCAHLAAAVAPKDQPYPQPFHAKWLAAQLAAREEGASGWWPDAGGFSAMLFEPAGLTLREV